MNKYCGYYSIIQYCPDRTLMEVASIGVLMFCPQLGYVGVRTTRNNRRIEKIFGQNVGNENFLQSYKDGLCHHFDKRFQHGVSYEEMQSYLRSFVNDVCFTEIRTTLVVDPEQALDSLFTRVFGAEEATQKSEMIHYRPRKKLLEALRSRSGDILDKIAIPKSVIIPEYEHAIAPAMIFLNEHVNLVVPRMINKDNAAQRAGFGLVVGELLDKHELEWGRSKMVILANVQPEDESDNFFAPYRIMLEKNGVKYYDKENILLQDILDHARELPEQLAKYAASKQRELFV